MNKLLSSISRPSDRTTWFLIGLVCAVTLLFPGNSPWINDAPKLFIRALSFNAKGTLADIGLYGSLRLPYGALPTMLYQFFLLFTNDLVLMVVIKTVLTLTATIVSLRIIAKHTSLPLWGILFALLSPYLYFYARHLWDNCYLIPVSGLLAAAYVLFINRVSARVSFFALTACCAILVQIHLMSAFILLPLPFLLLAFHRDWLLKYWKWTAFSVATCTLFMTPYVLKVLATPHSERSFGGGASQSLLDSLTGVNFYSFIGFFEYYAPEVLSLDGLLPTALIGPLVLITGLSLIFFAIGVTRAIGNEAWLAENKTRRELALWALLSIVITIAVYLYTGLRHHPHYMNALWFPFFYLLWLGVDYLRNRKWLAILPPVQLSCMTILLLGFVSFIEQHSGTRGNNYGATLENQIELAQQVVAYHPKTKVKYEVSNYQRYGHAFKALRMLYRKDKNAPPAPPLQIVYAEKPYGRIELISSP